MRFLTKKPQIKDGKGNFVTFHCSIEEDLKPPEKIKMKTITFEYGEGRTPNNSIPVVFTTWEEANDY